MTLSRTLIITGGLLAGAALAFSQTPPPAPPAPPAPIAAPAAAAAPTPMPRPAPRAIVDGKVVDWDDLSPALRAQIEAKMDSMRDQIDNLHDLTPEIRAKVAAATAKFNFDFNIDADAIRDQVEAAQEQIRAIEPSIAFAKGFGNGVGIGIGKGGFAFAPQIGTTPPMPPKPPVAVNVRNIGRMSADSAYSNGQRALDDRRWDNAVDYFSQVVSRGSTRADGALYWKAYALGKLSKRDEAMATLAELRKSHPQSRWLDDAKALELQINQANSTFVSPEAENNDELKILAINGLMQTDAERYLPALESILKGSGSPKLKRNALYVLAVSSSPKAQGLVDQIARGSSGNPDLQVKAINYLTERRRSSDTTNNARIGQMLSEIYGSTSDPEVKRAALNGLVSLKDKDRLLSVVKNEKDPDLRSSAINYFGEVPGNAELWQLYQSETTTEGKIQILRHAYRNGSADKVLEVLRTEKEPKLRIEAARVLSSYPASQVTAPLISAYGTEQDEQVKRAIADTVFSHRDGKAMVDLVKAEKDSTRKLRLVERLSGQKNCKECSDYLVEILNK
jgi:HEAT repeat protein